MVKYVTRAVRADYVDADAELTLVPNLTVDSAAPACTGLYDRHGREYMRLPNQIGYVQRKDTA